MKLIELRNELSRRLYENPEMKKKIRSLSMLQWIESSYAFDAKCGCVEDILEIDDVQKIIMNGVIDSKSIKDHIAVKNYYDMIKYLYEIVPLSYRMDISLIEKINALLTRDEMMKEKMVKYRKDDAPFVEDFALLTPEPDYISSQMYRFIRDYGSVYGEYNPVHRACYVHNELLRIYPFAENNEATARALLNFELISGGYLPVVFKMDCEKYYEAVKMHINEDDERPFYKLILEAEKETYINYIDLILR